VAFCSDLNLAQAAVERVTQPDHINVAALGNQVPHLHWHIIPRYKTDDRWGGPVWTTTEEEMKTVSLSNSDYEKLLGALREQFI
jgi:diadenosine tetraphosphate (Ap4A) HIT family hydrolase